MKMAVWLWTCCEPVVKVVSLLWLNFSFIWKSLHNKTTTRSRQCCNNSELVVEIEKFVSLQQVHNICNICNIFTTSATCSQQVSHLETPLRQVQNNPTSITTRSRQTYHWYPTKVPQYSQQGKDSCFDLTTTWQQVHNLHDWSAITLSQQFHNRLAGRWFIWRPDFRWRTRNHVQSFFMSRFYRFPSGSFDFLGLNLGLR